MKAGIYYRMGYRFDSNCPNGSIRITKDARFSQLVHEINTDGETVKTFSRPKREQ